MRGVKTIRMCVRRGFRFGISLFGALLILSAQAASQCSLIDNSQGAVYISYEETSRVKDDDGKVRDGVVLRLHNNSTCAVQITTGYTNKFNKPLPENPTFMQRMKTEIEYVLPDGVLVPAVQYRHRTSSGFRQSVGGGSFLGFSVFGGRTIPFEVPLIHFGPRMLDKIELVFVYEWEVQNRTKYVYPSVENIVPFFGGSLPSYVRNRKR